MWIVRVALSRPYTFIVLALLLPLFGALTLLGAPGKPRHGHRHLSGHPASR